MNIYYLKDEGLCEGLKRGDSTAFEALLDTYGDRIMKVCFLILKDTALAEDAVQETFIRVYRGIRKFNGGSSIYTWIYKIAVNKCRDMLRKRREHYPLDDVLAQQVEFDVEDLVMKDTSRERIREIVFSLSPRYREIVILFYFADLSIKDISMILEESEGTIKSKLHRARAILKEALSKEAAGYENGRV